MSVNNDKNITTQILIIAMLTAGVLIFFEFIKSTWWPDLGLWPSHIATIIFVTLCAVIASHSVISKERQLRRQTEMALSWREEAESLVASSDRARRMIFDGVYDAVMIHNAAGAIIDINQSTLDLFQADSQHMIGGWVQDFFVSVDETPEPLTEIWAKVLRGEEQLFHYRARRPSDGSVFDVEVFLRRIQLGEKDLLLANIRDLTELKHMKEFAHLQEQKLIQADKMASLGVLVSGMAHEINNPNNYVLLNARVLSKAWNDIQPIVEEYYEANGDFAIAGMPYSSARDRLGNLYMGITEGAIRIERIVQHLKDFARQTGDHVYGEVDVNQAVEASVEILRGLILRSTGHFQLDCAPDLPKIHGNSVHLEQVLVNLITNACQALRSHQEKIRVVTRWESDNKRVLLSVTDEGEGITDENMQHIMDPFYTTKREHGGTGLGLSISYNLIKNFGGELKISSTPGSGTSVEVWLPVTSRPVTGVQQGD